MENIIKNDKGFIGKNGFKISKLTDEECILEYEIKESGLNPMGMVHGGILFGLADTSAGALSFYTGRKCVTTSATMNYLNPAKEGKVYARATALKIGNRIGYYDVVITDDNGKVIATSMVNMYFNSNK